MLKISNIQCKKLYGKSDYFIDFSTNIGGHFNILYGENGSGKTTLLRLVYSILSNTAGEKNKSFIARVPFENLRIEFSDGFKISVDRTRRLIGPYKIIVVPSGIDGFSRAEIKSFDVNPNKDFRVDEDNSPTLADFEKLIIGLRIDISLVMDDRSVFSTVEAKPQQVEDDDDFPWGEIMPPHFHDGSDPASSKPRLEIRSLYDKAAEKIKDRVIAGSFQAQDNINQIYLGVADRLAKAKVLRDSKTDSTNEFMNKLNTFDDSYKMFGNFGLIPNISSMQLRHAIDGAPKRRRNAIAAALSPLVENTILRLRELTPVLKTIDIFLTEVNRFLRGKELRYNSRIGFHIVDQKNVIIDWQWLSSGEKQLVFLLGTIFIKLGDNAIILIDEPEISLNVKWQRMFIDSVERLTLESDGQFILASHSVEIIAGHMEAVSQLCELNDEQLDG